ncbi:hypothetical protein Nepgr_033121 [Nepenthes gracilis]|uniref:Tubulin-folding cofactor D ARM repeats domain-containing protein n=1 Tax=Nepenthes gracilis TaxID=150966 RepID=A0AAD3TJY0_NEPGR|nr:hypothetical protein Nepgr_033121 [Nepenthes gracilis]
MAVAGEDAPKIEAMAMTVNEDDDEHGTKESVLHKYFLREWKVVKSIVDDIVSNGRVSDFSSVHKIRSIMDKYQEQGQLLQPYLESIVSPLMFVIQSKTIELGVESDEILEVVKPVCIIIYTVVTVCGYKAVIKFFPHQVSDLEHAVFLLEKCYETSTARQESTGEMEAKCAILLWLSILVLVPFDISSVDTSIAESNYYNGDEPPPLVLRILGFCKDYLSNAGPMCMIFGLLLLRLLTRPDMMKAFISFIEWTHAVLSSSSDNVVDHFCLLGVVEALAAIFKGKVTSLCNNISLDAVERTDQGGHGAESNLLNREESVNGEQEEEIDVPEPVEEIIEVLLTGLKDTSSSVAIYPIKSKNKEMDAKGIGRITSCLTYYLSDKVLSSVLELFSPCEGDGSWHGGCLALAELACRGLLLPLSLPKVVPVVAKALHYDIQRGPHSVGAHVRDAASYVCWAFGRAYCHSDMRTILEQLAPHPLVVACYDREDKSLRELAAKAISALVKFDTKYCANLVLDKVILSTLSTDLCMRHGATLAAGELVLALHQCNYVLSTDK